MEVTIRTNEMDPDKMAEAVQAQVGRPMTTPNQPLNDDQKVYMAKQYLRRLRQHNKMSHDYLADYLKKTEGEIPAEHHEWLSMVAGRMEFCGELASEMREELNRKMPKPEPFEYEG